MISRKRHRLRVQLAQEAARIILNEGVKDYQIAKRKASERLRISDRVALPRNIEIEQAILSHQKLFFTNSDYDHQLLLWKVALGSMRFLRAFTPRLVGAILNGTAGKHSDVNLHLFADTQEEVLILLIDKGIPYRSVEKRIHYGSEYQYYPTLRYDHADIEIEAVVFPRKMLWNPPLSASDGKPIKRAEIREVEKRLAMLTEQTKSNQWPS